MLKSKLLCDNKERSINPLALSLTPLTLRFLGLSDLSPQALLKSTVCSRARARAAFFFMACYASKLSLSTLDRQVTVRSDFEICLRSWTWLLCEFTQPRACLGGPFSKLTPSSALPRFMIYDSRQTFSTPRCKSTKLSQKEEPEGGQTLWGEY